MKEEQRKELTAFAIIPASVRFDERLQMGARLLYGDILGLSNIHGYCYATNAFFAHHYNTVEKTITRWINSLEKCGHIQRIIIRDERKQVIERRLKPCGLDTFKTRNFNVPPAKNFNVPPARNINVPYNNTSSINTSNNNNVVVDKYSNTNNKELVKNEPTTSQVNLSKKLKIDIDGLDRIAVGFLIEEAIAANRRKTAYEEPKFETCEPFDLVEDIEELLKY